MFYSTTFIASRSILAGITTNCTQRNSKPNTNAYIMEINYPCHCLTRPYEAEFRPKYAANVQTIRVLVQKRQSNIVTIPNALKAKYIIYRHMIHLPVWKHTERYPLRDPDSVYYYH